MLARWQARAAADVMHITAQGQADAIRLISDAQAEAHQTFSVIPASVRGELDIREEIQSRLQFQEEKRQRNLESVVTKAADHLGDKQVADHDVDHDWIAQFFADAQDVSSVQMQEIWAKILSGEVENPGRTSLHTLSILKNMTQRDAELFARTSRFILADFILNSGDVTDTIEGFPNYRNLIDLQSYGLVALGVGIIRYINLDGNGVGHLFDRNFVYRVSCQREAPPSRGRIEFPAHILTPQGKQLFSVVQSNIDPAYISTFAEFMRDREHCGLEQALVILRSGDGVRHGPWTPVEPHAMSSAENGP